MELYGRNGLDFSRLLAQHLYSPVEDGYCVFMTPKMLLLAQEREDEGGRYWFVSYASEGSIANFLRMMPYPLDRCAWERYVKDPERGISFHSTEKLIQRYHGI